MLFQQHDGIDRIKNGEPGWEIQAPTKLAQYLKTKSMKGARPEMWCGIGCDVGNPATQILSCAIRERKRKNLIGGYATAREMGNPPNESLCFAGTGPGDD